MIDLHQRMRIKRKLQDYARSIKDPNRQRAFILSDRANFARDAEAALRRGAGDEADDAVYYAHGLWEVLFEIERAVAESHP
jgi:hypothetical protein